MTALSSEDFISLIQQAKHTHDWAPVAKAIPYFSYLGMQVREEAGGLICVLPENRKFVGNPVLPALHGGIVGAFLESTALVQMFLTQEVTQLPKIINITIEYLRSAKLAEMYAEAIITKPGRRVANMRVLAWQTDRDKPIATATANFLVS
jgi:uncharacterized protein (TIGR00369 family)